MADLVSVDQLGFTCIREEEIDVAFHATGKGVRLPRTCLPEPCRAALTQVDLASLIGRAPMRSEWDDYVSRYADHCRKEVVAFDEAGGTDDIRDPAGFWAPLIASYPPNAPIRSAVPNRPGTPIQLVSTGPGGGGGGGGGGGFGPGPGPGPGPSPSNPGTGPGDPDDETDPFFPFDPGPDPTEDPDPILPTPLPGGLVMALTGVAFLITAHRRRKSS